MVITRQQYQEEWSLHTIFRLSIWRFWDIELLVTAEDERDCRG